MVTPGKGPFLSLTTPLTTISALKCEDIFADVILAAWVSDQVQRIPVHRSIAMLTLLLFQ
jgi:hypothetical protein